jgi:hypothetical protein
MLFKLFTHEIFTPNRKSNIQVLRLLLKFVNCNSRRRDDQVKIMAAVRVSECCIVFTFAETRSARNLQHLGLAVILSRCSICAMNKVL